MLPRDFLTLALNCCPIHSFNPRSTDCVGGKTSGTSHSQGARGATPSTPSDRPARDSYPPKRGLFCTTCRRIWGLTVAFNDGLVMQLCRICAGRRKACSTTASSTVRNGIYSSDRSRAITRSGWRYEDCKPSTSRCGGRCGGISAFARRNDVFSTCTGRTESVRGGSGTGGWTNSRRGARWWTDGRGTT